MAVQIAGFTATNIAEVEANTRAMRMTPKPVDYGIYGIYSLAASTGVMAAGLAAGAPIWSFRWGVGTHNAVVKKIIISSGNTATAFAAGVVTFNLFVARSFSASDTGGTSILPSGNQNKLRTSMATTALVDARISSTASLTAGTRTLDANPIGSVSVSIPAVAGTTLLMPSDLFRAQAGDYPIVLAQNEGLVITATVPATGTWSASIQCQWEELSNANTP